MKKFLLIDGNAILHRAYHALPPLTNNKGEIVNAVYGFFSMLLTVGMELKPEYLVVCFDRAKPTFRQTMYAGYQQNRPKMADDLVPQVGILHKMLEKMGVVVFELDGYEADDLIGTICEQAVGGKKKDIEVIILSGDRDMLQLVNGRVKVLAPVVGVKNTILFDSAKVKEKYGINPSQIVDYKALVGDASDGYPGVAGIGPKTASNLLRQYGMFENLYQHVGELPEKIGLKLANDAEQAALAKKLATIMTDVPIQFAVENCAIGKIDVQGMRKAFEEQGFKSLLRRAETFFGLEPSIVDPVVKKEKVKKTDSQLGLLD